MDLRGRKQPRASETLPAARCKKDAPFSGEGLRFGVLNIRARNPLYPKPPNPQPYTPLPTSEQLVSASAEDDLG